MESHEVSETLYEIPVEFSVDFKPPICQSMDNGKSHFEVAILQGGDKVEGNMQALVTVGGKPKGRRHRNLNWLPPDWRVEYKTRTTGATAGVVDMYFHDPVYNQRFRSKKEVLEYLSNGERRMTSKIQ